MPPSPRQKVVENYAHKDRVNNIFYAGTSDRQAGTAGCGTTTTRPSSSSSRRTRSSWPSTTTTATCPCLRTTRTASCPWTTSCARSASRTGRQRRKGEEFFVLILNTRLRNFISIRYSLIPQDICKNVLLIKITRP